MKGAPSRCFFFAALDLLRIYPRQSRRIIEKNIFHDRYIATKTTQTLQHVNCNKF
jgi:hypothetical protein